MLAITLCWLSFMVWVADASICDIGPCTCDRGKVQCDCTGSSAKEIMLKDKNMLDYLTTFINVSNCNHVHVASLVLSGLPGLQKVSLTNIRSLTLGEEAFRWTTGDHRHPGVVIEISHCVIPEIPSYTFRGSLRDILLTEVNVSRTRPFAFAAIDHAEKMQFTRVRFTKVDPQTFKKLITNFLTFVDCYINELPPKTMVNVEVHKEVRLENIKVDRIRSKAIHLHSNKLKLAMSTIGYIEENAFLVHMKGDVLIEDNIFTYLERRTFLGITVDNRYLREAGKQDLIFENNTLIQAESGSLAFNTTVFDVRLDWIRLNEPCSCERVESWSNDLVALYTNLNISSPTKQVNRLMYCLNPKTTSVVDYQKRNCEVSTFSSLLVKTILIVGIISFLVTIGTIVYCVVKKRGKRYINVPSPPKTIKSAESNKGHMLVVPDGKTYQETELHVIVEHLDPIVATEYIKQEPDTAD